MTVASASPFGLAATLHDAVALAQNFGPGSRIGFGADLAGTSDILAPAGLVLQPQEALAALGLLRRRYVFAFGNGDIAGLADRVSPVIDTLSKASGIGFMAACAATPWARRTVYQGQLFEGASLRLDLRRDFTAALAGNIGIIPHEIIRTGAAAIFRQCAVAKDQGLNLVWLDAIDDDDCAAIAEALSEHGLTGGAAWITNSMRRPAPELPTGPVAILSGGRDRQTLYQIGAARLVLPVHDLDLTMPDPAATALAWAMPRIGNTPLIIAAASPAAECLGAIAQGLIANGVTRLILTGNDTATKILQILQIRELVTGAAFGPLTWFSHDKLSICIKLSGVGGRDLFLSGIEPQIRLNETAE